jgi:hypothetical protein
MFTRRIRQSIVSMAVPPDPSLLIQFEATLAPSPQRFRRFVADLGTYRDCTLVCNQRQCVIDRGVHSADRLNALSRQREFNRKSKSVSGAPSV